MFRRLILALTLLPCPLIARADDLPRRAWLGAALERAEQGVRVRDVLPDSSAQTAGLKPGDILQKLDGHPVASPPEILALLRPLKAGHELKAELLRDGKTLALAIPMKEWPREPENDAYAIEYGDVPSPAGRLRTITYAPRSAATARKPAFLLIQGLSAATLDHPRPGEPLDQPTGMGIYRTLADAAARAGFVTVRVDKGGCGDSEGDPARLDFQQEYEGYRAALAALRNRPDVDPDRIFLFGHSMGGVFAPMLAADSQVKGAAVYGTVIKTWLEYLAENTRRQVMLSGADPAAFDSLARLMEQFHHAMIVERKVPSSIFEANPPIAAIKNELNVNGDTMFGRHFTFFQQLADQNLAALWKAAAPRTLVLALWGEAEYVSTREDHEWIADLVNREAPGHAAFAVLPRSDHGFNHTQSPKDAMQKLAESPRGSPSNFNPEILAVLTTWLRKTADLTPEAKP